MDAKATHPLTIGEFGRRSGLSLKALRLYEVSGLLAPVQVDPGTGYRRYAANQLDRARRISLLRQLDVPLTVVAEILAGTNDEAIARLDRWWLAQEASLQARRGTLSWLRAHLARAGAGGGHGGGGEPLSHAVHRRDVPAAKVAAIRSDVDQQGLLEGIRDAEWEIRRHLDSIGARTTAEHWVIFHGFVTPDSEAPIEVCVPFTGLVEPVGRIAIRVEAAHPELYTTVARDDCYYPRILHAYDAVEAHRADLAVMPAGPWREIYFAAWNDVGGSDPFAHVARPVALEG